MTDAIKPLLIFAYGNPSRGDDALGPLLLDRLMAQADASRIEFISDFQLQIEYALELAQREQVWFIDAAVIDGSAFSWSLLQPLKDHSYSSHALSPAALLHVYQTITGLPPPPAYLLSIQAISFELGADLSTTAAANLDKAWAFLQQKLLDNGTPNFANLK